MVPLKFVDKFIFLDINISSTESEVTLWIGKAWTDIDSSSTMWKTDISDQTKQEFFPTVAASVQLYGCTTWTLSNTYR